MCQICKEIGQNCWWWRYIGYWMNKITCLSFCVYVFFVAGSADMQKIGTKYCPYCKYCPFYLIRHDQSHVNKLTVDVWRWPKSLFVRLASHGWGGWHCWRRSEDKALHSLGHAWATRLAPDLHTVHPPPTWGPTGSRTQPPPHIHTRAQ